MTTGTQAPFFQEVLDALLLNNHPDLVLLRDLCDATDRNDLFSAQKAATDLVKLGSRDIPLEGISSALYYELMARVLKLGPNWSDEFMRLMAWYEPLLRFADTSEEKLVDNWIGVLTRVPEPEPGLTAGELIRAWKSEINCLQRALADLAKLDLPTVPAVYSPESEPTRGFGTASPLPTLEEQMQTAVEHFFRNTHMLFQQMLERAVLQLENNRTAELLRILRRLHADRANLIDEQMKLADVDKEKAARAVFMRIRITEIQDGRPPRIPHLYLDAFRPYRSRNIPISSFDRDEAGPLSDLPGLLGESHVMRNFQLAYYFSAYGEPSDDNNTMTPELQRRQDLINGKHRGQLKLGSNDDLVVFLTNFFEDTVKERMDAKDSFADASAIAWVAVLKFLHAYLGRMTAHTPFNITEDDPNYLTREFPRSLIGGLLHDCGVYAVRMAYVLLAMSRRVDRIFPHTFDMQASWVLLPLHVGLILDSKTLALVVIHNESVSVASDDKLNEAEAEWSQNLTDDVDPTDAGALRQKLIEDVAASFFNNDVDMPLLRFPVLTGTAPATTRTIWYSYRRKVVRNYDKLFSPLVSVRRAKQYQFDLRYLDITRLQKRWFNRFVVPFWNQTCKKIFDDFEARLRADPAKNKDDYAALLEAAIAPVKAAQKEVFDAKVQLSTDLRNDRKLLRSGVRGVFSERLSSFSEKFGPVGQVEDHVAEVKQPGFNFIDATTKQFVKPLFALPEEALVRLPE